MEREGAVGAPGLAGPVAGQRDRAVGEEGADGAAAQDVALDPRDREIGRLDPGVERFVGVDVQRPDVEGAHLAGDPPAADDGHHGPLAEADAARIEQRGRVALFAGRPAADLPQRAVAGAGAAAAGEVEDAPAFEEELALLGEEQVEPRQVHLLLVHLDLGEVGVPGQVGGQVAGDAVLDVQPAVAVAVVAARRVRGEVGGDPGDAVRLDLEVGAAGRHVEPHQQGGVGHAEDAPAPGRDGHRRDVGHLVLAAHGAADLHPPLLPRPRPVAQRPERNGHLHRPAALEPPRPHVPHRIPVAVRVAFVGDAEVADRPQGVGVERDAVAPVVEGVERDPERVVLAQLRGVAAHLVGHPLAGRGRVPHPPGDVDGGLVEQDPRLGLLARGRAFDGHLLDEAGDGGHGAVHRFVEPAVEPEAGRETDGPDRRAALRVARDHRRGARRRRAVGQTGQRESGGTRGGASGRCLLSLDLGRRRGSGRRRGGGRTLSGR